jgi:hypothetical protein
MSALAIVLALFLQDQPAAADAAAQPAPAAEAPATETRAAEPPPADAAPEVPHPKGAPTDPYQFVAWCYGSLRGYLDLHDEVMPEVTRIESTYRPPGRKLSDDLKVYADMQKDGRQKLKTYQAALTAAEKASVRPINTIGGAAVRQGGTIWQAGPAVTKARKAQEWMSWALPARCDTVAASLEARARLMGATFRVNQPAEPAAAPAETEAKPTDVPAAESTAKQQPPNTAR